MYTKKEILWEALSAANGCLEFREDTIGYSDNLVTINEMINHVKDLKTFMTKLTAADKTPTPSDTRENTPPWIREFRNLNSNGIFLRYGLIEDIPYDVQKGLQMSPLGRNITKPELWALMDKIDAPHNPKKMNFAITRHGRLPGIHDPLKASVKIEEKIPTTNARYHDSQRIKDYALARSAGSCESCLSKLPANSYGGKIHQIHHMFDVHSKDENILSKVRYDHINHIICVCGRCHDILHQGVNSTELNFEAAKKIKTVNVLIDADVNPVEILTAQQKKIITF